MQYSLRRYVMILVKTITDMHVELFDKKKKKLVSWSPFKGPMTEFDDARQYTMQYRRNRTLC